MSSYLSSNSTALPSIHCPNSSSTALPSLHCPNSNSTALPSFHCPYFPIFLQWQDSYLTHEVFISSVFASTINGLTSIITTVSNALVIISLLKSRQFRQNPFMFLFVSLSVTDFLVGLLVQPLFVVSRLCEMFGRPDVLCTIRMLYKVTGVMCSGSSLGHISLISFERYLAVRFPNRYKTLISLRNTIAGIAFVWLFFILYAILPVTGYPEIGKFAGRSLVIATNVVITASCYTGTFYKVGSSSAAVSSGHVSVASLQRIKKEKKLATTMLLTVGILALCYFPEMIIYPVMIKNPENVNLVQIGRKWTQTILHSNSLVNPLWYCWRLRAIRKAVFKLVGFAQRQRYDNENILGGKKINSFNNQGRKYLTTAGLVPMSGFESRPASALDARYPEKTTTAFLTSPKVTEIGNNKKYGAVNAVSVPVA